ncbi:MAG: alpha/beta fold hydrolase [Bacteroidetes bacterium]|nr:alpha/beta fold hydrolase [Bacteroidota bacterium]
MLQKSQPKNYSCVLQVFVILVFVFSHYACYGQVTYHPGIANQLRTNQQNLPPQFLNPEFDTSAGATEGIVVHNPITRHDVHKHFQPTSEFSGSIDSGLYKRFSRQHNPALHSAGQENDNFSTNVPLQPTVNPANWPACVNCKLIIHVGSNVYEASGILVDSRSVLTAGHVLFSPAYGGDGWADQVEVIPAYTEPNEPYGHAMGAQFSVVEHWWYQDEYKDEFDLGVVLLERPVGALTGWYGFDYQSDDFFFTHTFWNFNYPAASPYTGCCEYYRSGPFDAIYNNNILAINSTFFDGQDGSGAYYNDPTNGRMVYGILSIPYPPPTYEQTAFVRITWLKWVYIANTIDNYTPVNPLLFPLQVQVNPDSVQPGQTFTTFTFKVHNYSFNDFSGTQNVDIYLSTDKNITPTDMKISSGYFTGAIPSLGTITVNVPNMQIPCTPPSSPNNLYYIGIALDNQFTSDQDVAKVKINAQDTSHFETELMWNRSPSYPMIQGVVSDGSSTLKIRLNRTSGDSEINSIFLQLQAVSGEVDGPLGSVGSTTTIITGASCSVPGSSGNDQWDFYYKAPEKFSNNSNSNSPVRILKAVFTINATQNGNPVCKTVEQIIKIIRPPVLLIHGLGDNSECFSSLYTDLLNSNKYSKYQVKCVDYRWSNTYAFVENVRVIASDVYEIKDFWNLAGYEVDKVDLVGHSMGGVLSRLYLQSPGYKNDIHKLITVNTPHAGSQGANLIYDFQSIFSKYFDVICPAVSDLRVTSPSTRDYLNGPARNNRVVPSYAICTETENLDPVFRSNMLFSAIYLAFKLKFPEYFEIAESIPPLIFLEPNDLVVAQSSQIGGLSKNSITEGEWHNGAPSNLEVKSRIKDLLEVTSSDNSFSTGGFNPTPLTPWWYGKNSNQKMTFDDTVHFINPLPGAIVQNGQNLDINISGTSNIRNIVLNIRETQNSVLIVDSVTSNLHYIYSIPQTACGIIKLLAFGLDSLSNVFADSTYINIQMTGTPDSLFIPYPPDSLVLSQGLMGSVYVSCKFSNGIIRDITTLPETQYSIQTQNATIVSKGIFKGVHQGSDSLIVSYLGLTVKLPIHIGQYYIQKDSIHTSANICAGQNYLFYGQSLDSTGTFSKTFTNQYGCDSVIFLNLAVNEVPATPGVITGPSMVLPGQSGIIYQVDSIPGATSYHWNLPTGISIISGINTNSITVSISDTVVSGGLSVFGINTCGNGNLSPTLIISSGYTISGSFRYNNVANTTIDSLELKLYKNNSLVDTKHSDISGHYAFSGKSDGTYILKATTNKPWSGVNGTDALKIQRHFAGIEYLTEPVRILAADVNNSNSINGTDALKVKRRFAGLDTTFARGNWTFAKPVIGGDTILVSGSDVTQNFYGLCVGDVNGSNVPGPGAKSTESLELNYNGTILPSPGQEFEIQLTTEDDLSVSAVSLLLSYPDDLISINSLSMKEGSPVYTLSDGQIRLAWSEINPMKVAKGEPLLTMKARVNENFKPGDVIRFGLGSESELADESAEVISGAGLKMPEIGAVTSIKDPGQACFICSVKVQPNPAKGTLNLEFDLTKSSDISISLYDLMGIEVKRLKTSPEKAGKIRKQLDVSGFANGTYFLKIHASGPNQGNPNIVKIIIQN